MNPEIILELKGLKKYFGPVHAVEEVNLRVPRGQVYGFLGPNGAGKTTTIGIILGLTHPTAGSVHLFGNALTPESNQSLNRVGALVGAPSLVPYLSARKNLELVARLSPALPAHRIAEILERVGLSEAAERAAGRFSSGMKQRLGLAMALLHEPELLVLDEPTNGMDPAGMREVRLLLRELASRGVTIFLSSHLLHEIEQVCDQVAVLDKGRIIAQGKVDNLLGKRSLVKVRVDAPVEAARLLEKLPGAEDVQPNGVYVSVGNVTSKQVVAHLVAGGVVPSEVANVNNDLESMFLELTQEAL
jgi:ABC-type multidrug transport system ATPase subunit